MSPRGRARTSSCSTMSLKVRQSPSEGRGQPAALTVGVPRSRAAPRVHNASRDGHHPSAPRVMGAARVGWLGTGMRWVSACPFEFQLERNVLHACWGFPDPDLFAIFLSQNLHHLPLLETAGSPSRTASRKPSRTATCKPSWDRAPAQAGAPTPRAAGRPLRQTGRRLLLSSSSSAGSPRAADTPAPRQWHSST